MPGLANKERLKNRKYISSLYERGKTFRGKNVNLIFLERQAGKKAAFAAARQYTSAVERNLIKRRMREAYRLNKEKFPGKTHYMFIGKNAAEDIRFESLQNEFVEIALKVAMYGNDSS